jgi:4-carboxymuconolactone decarboxylase
VTDRYQLGLAKLAEYTSPEAGQTHLAVAESLHDIAPDVARFIVEFAYGDIYTRPGLDNQERAMVTLASLVTLGTEAQIELHVNTALTSGIAPAKIIEILTHLIPYTGFPRVLNGLGVAKRVFAQRNVTV